MGSLPRLLKTWNACLTSSIVCYLFLALFVDWSSILAFIPIYFSGFRLVDRISDSGVSYSPVIKFLVDRCSFIFSFSNLSVFLVCSLSQDCHNSRFSRQSSFLALKQRPLFCSIRYKFLSLFFLILSKRLVLREKDVNLSRMILQIFMFFWFLKSSIYFKNWISFFSSPNIITLFSLALESLILVDQGSREARSASVKSNRSFIRCFSFFSFN